MEASASNKDEIGFLRGVCENLDPGIGCDLAGNPSDRFPS
jgi:hypothetical protein